MFMLLSVKLHLSHFYMTCLQAKMWLAVLWLWASLKVAIRYNSCVAMLVSSLVWAVNLAGEGKREEINTVTVVQLSSDMQSYMGS